MNIQQLEYIIAVDKFKSFSGAAAHCYVTQANLSAMVKKLEVELDTILFDRRSKTVVLTAAGNELIAEARQIVEHTQLLFDKAKAINKRIGGRLKVGMIPTIATTLHPIIADECAIRYPDLDIDVDRLTADEIVKQVKDGQLDFGILGVPALPLELGKVILFHEALVGYGDKQSKTAWLYEEGHHLNAQLSSLLASKVSHENLFPLPFEPNDLDLMLNKIDHFGAFTLIPELCYQMLSEERKERVTMLSPIAPVREISLVFHKKYTNGYIIQAMADLIRNKINESLKGRHFSIANPDVISV